jgi:hypothetical protein
MSHSIAEGNIMDLVDHLRDLANRIPKLSIQTEEAVKTALVLPFIQALGYDVFNPHEVTPELTADVGTKKGEKVDYAILRDGNPIILFECKGFKALLQLNHASQLYRYFSTREARFGVLTNGVEYHFYTDLVAPNKMDEVPFFIFNLLDFSDAQVETLKRFTKSAFDANANVGIATGLKQRRIMREFIEEMLIAPK